MAAYFKRTSLLYARLHGPFFFFYPNEKVESTGEFLNNERHGKWSYYHEDGKLKYEVEFLNDHEYKPITRYDSAGKQQMKNGTGFGGTAALDAIIQKNLRYPASARSAKVQGRVILDFIVEKNGTISSSV